MPNSAKGDFQTLRLSKVPVETVRKIKSEAALLGITQEEYLRDFLVFEFKNELDEEARRDEGRECGQREKPSS